MTRSATLPFAPPRVRAPHRLWLFALAVAAAIGGGFALDHLRVERTARLEPTALRPGFGHATFAEAVAGADIAVASARENLASAPDEWWRGEQLAYALVARWRLTGDYEDLAEAELLLDEGLAAAPNPAGPVLLSAQLAVTTHRLDRADAALARMGRWAVPYPGELADAAALAGDIALQRGDVRAAAAKYRAAVRIVPAPGMRLRRAVLAAQSGERDAAEAQLEALIAEPRQPPATLAALMLHRANLAYAHGDWATAGQWIGGAQRAFPGWWLADSYAAQQFALAGRTADAIRAWQIVAERSGRPEVMDALAHLLRLHGRSEASRAWAARAAAGWEARAALFPEAVALHRAEHELALGSPARALALAEADVERRPQAPGIQVLARALILTGRPREALAWVDRAERQSWASPALLMLRADAAAALGDETASDAAREAAEALNPRAADDRSRLIWFGHG